MSYSKKSYYSCSRAAAPALVEIRARKDDWNKSSGFAQGQGDNRSAHPPLWSDGSGGADNRSHSRVVSRVSCGSRAGLGFH